MQARRTIESFYSDTKISLVKQSSLTSNVQKLSIYNKDIDELRSSDHNYYLLKDNNYHFVIAIT